MIKSKVLLTVLLLTAVSLSCENSDEPKVKSEFEQVGVEHNIALDKAFTILQDLKSKGAFEIDSYFNSMEQTAIDYALAANPDLTKTGKLFITDHVKEMNRALKDFARDRNFASFHEKILHDVDHLLTKDQKVFVKEILTTSSEVENLDNTLADLDNIEQRIIKTVNKDEQPVLLASLSVAKNSLKYWNENYEKWMAAFAKPGTSARTQWGKINWGWVAGSDIGAAVGVGIVTSTALVVPFIGWGAWIGGVAAGATIASAGAVIIQAVAGREDVYAPTEPYTLPDYIPYGSEFDVRDYLYVE